MVLVYLFSCALCSESHANLGGHELKCPPKKMKSPNTGEKRDEIVKSDYDCQPSGLEREPRDGVCQENRSYSPAAKTPTIIKEDGEDGSERAPNFLNEFADMLLPVSKQAEGQIA